MIYRFDDIHIDRAAWQVMKGSTPIHLTRKAFELLLLLVERRPDVVSKDDIHRHLWPDTFVSESSIQALVSEIRQNLDNGSKRIIRTVHGVGYACVAEIEEVAKDAKPATAAARAWLVGEAWRVALYDGPNIVGRGSDDVIEIDAPGVSRRHARIDVGDTVTIEDLGSKNGTWLRDQRVTAAAHLSDGDQVRLGSLLLTFRRSRGVDSTDTQARSRSRG